MGLDHFTTQAKWALGPLSDGSKDHGTHNAPLFPGSNFMLFQTRENTALLSFGCGKLKGLGELMRILSASEGEVGLDSKRLGIERFPTHLRRMVP